MTLAPLVLLASPDDYLLELERHERESAWQQAHPEGEIVLFDAPPPIARLVQELTNPSLFAPQRFLVVRGAESYFDKEDDGAEQGRQVASALGDVSFSGVALLLAATLSSEPAKGHPLAVLVRERGELAWLPRPAQPKPWEQVRVSPEERRVLEEKVIRRVSPELLTHSDVLDALYEAYGFHPRELAQAAQRLVLAGEVSPDAVRTQAGPGECSPRDLEEAIVQRDPRAAARFFAILSAGGTLVGWRGEVINREGYGPVLGGLLARLLRQALAVRGHALAAGMRADLDPKRCAAARWYPATFSKGLYPRLMDEVEKNPGSPVAGMSAWQLHRLFRIAAAYQERELVEAIARVASSGAERNRGDEVITATSHLVLELIQHPRA